MSSPVGVKGGGEGGEGRRGEETKGKGRGVCSREGERGRGKFLRASAQRRKKERKMSTVPIGLGYDISTDQDLTIEQKGPLSVRRARRLVLLL